MFSFMKSNQSPDDRDRAEALVVEEQGTTRRWPRFLRDPAVRYALLLFLVSRLLLTLWAALITDIQPLPDQPDELARPPDPSYLVM